MLIIVVSIAKLVERIVDLEPGLDYDVKDGGSSWIFYPNDPATKHFRNTWVLFRKNRPQVPTFLGAPLPRHSQGEHQRSAAIVMTYFHPWTLRKQDADSHVKYAGSLRPIFIPLFVFGDCATDGEVDRSSLLWLHESCCFEKRLIQCKRVFRSSCCQKTLGLRILAHWLIAWSAGYIATDARIHRR